MWDTKQVAKVCLESRKIFCDLKREWEVGHINSKLSLLPVGP